MCGHEEWWILYAGRMSVVDPGYRKNIGCGIWLQGVYLLRDLDVRRISVMGSGCRDREGNMILIRCQGRQ